MTHDDAATMAIRPACIADLDTLLAVEQACFASDRLSRRSFRHQIQSDDSVLLVATLNHAPEKPRIVGYVLCFLHKGTRLARLYSLAVLPDARGMSLGKQLLNACEEAAELRERLYMRLEVAKTNVQAIAVYEASGYRKFGEYQDYYDDHQDALRMQKTLRHLLDRISTLPATWYRQTTDFTCGPAALMMAMSVHSKTLTCDQMLEVALWRESTTVFMTSGLGGTHPFGLALAAHRRGFQAEVFLNTKQVLFIDGVRTEKKKEIMTLVHDQFVSECEQRGVSLCYQDVNQEQLQQWLENGCSVIMLISTYRLDGKKTPHWVLLTGIDEKCLYVHDPDVDEKWQQPIDCQHVPIARKDFEKMSAFGSSRLRCAIVLQKSTT